MKNAHLMKRRSFLLMTSAAGASVAFPAYADYVNSVRDQLRQQGYRQISVSSTMLGRTRIVAKSKTGTREIIMNPRTGEILRDLWSSAQGSSGPSIVGSDADDPDDGQDDARDDDGDDDSDDDRDDDSDDDGDDDGGKGRGRGGDDGDSDGDGGGDD
ncbi:MAG: hypothetical protein RL128_1768 [Pseudomonadota bacterium]|jgi:hypothetical protein